MDQQAKDRILTGLWLLGAVSAAIGTVAVVSTVAGVAGRTAHDAECVRRGGHKHSRPAYDLVIGW